MPELPEVETTRRGIAPHITGRHVSAVTVRQPRLREAVPPELARDAVGQPVAGVERRGKYLLLRMPLGTIIIHLGMSGSLRVLGGAVPLPERHDHVDIVFGGGPLLRLHDPRRFGIVTWTSGDPLTHRLLARLGPEPLAAGFDGHHLYLAARGRGVAVKSLLLDGTVVAGVGNIYASEALFRAGIHPGRAAARISLVRYQGLARALREVLTDAIAAGGTTLRDFVDGSGRPGYFRQRLLVYGREGEPCPGCDGPIRRVILGQRSSYYCPRCQR
ncbi:MAG: bifunctional DNA-formamidopyrimidine glycosylase/DNA-(apurinic or apyrimidinic site) lyase [Gammaproteobacteria bacterium]|nr:bifunctional DNA-formamidopyrimidine glycosylase/DNA-(apurinic or apyrimidinic site) lyase [Gammaproteobacteria bacterium]